MNLIPNKSIVHNVIVEFTVIQQQLQHTSYQAQLTTVPQFTLNTVEIANGPWMSSSLQGQGVVFEPVVVTFLMDEKWKIYEEIYSWMLGEGNYKNGESNNLGVFPREMLIHIMDNKNEKPILTFRFTDVFPTVLGSVDFDYSDENPTYLKLPVTFKYKQFIIERNGKPLHKSKW